MKLLVIHSDYKGPRHQEAKLMRVIVGYNVHYNHLHLRLSFDIKTLVLAILNAARLQKRSISIKY